MTMNHPAPMIPVVPLVRHAAPADWTPIARAELAERLAKVGTTITELSDARERCGFPRLSEGTTWDRANAHLNVECPEIAAAIAQLRIEHTGLVTELGHSDRKVVAQARKLLGLKAGWALRIGELRALFAQLRVLELVLGGEVGDHSIAREYQLCERAGRYTGRRAA